MRKYLYFVLTGLILGLYTEFQLKLVAGIRPETFINAVLLYPVIMTIAYIVSKTVDKLISSRWRGDILHYLLVGFGGLAVEWTLLGNGPGSNALQLGMFAMWTTFCFGPRILSRDVPYLAKARKRFWTAFAIASMLLVVIVLLLPSPQAKLVISVLALSGLYFIWSIWLLIMARRSTYYTATNRQ